VGKRTERSFKNCCSGYLLEKKPGFLLRNPEDMKKTLLFFGVLFVFVGKERRVFNSCPFISSSYLGLNLLSRD
jgi:hypothetical protein